ncbi:MAG TPA: zinc ribbon domain-containing protein [Symbiobacteriaceae bacterium]|nr:zinc ribbon domain-containing protein [Symbiobacteriaceae bacterium]
MAQCPNCGTQNTNAKFCAQCGSPLTPAYPAPQPPPAARSPLPWILVGVLSVVVVGGAAFFLTQRERPAPAPVAQSSTTASTQPAASAPAKSTPSATAPANKLPSDPNNFYVGLFLQLRIPGVAYVSDNGYTVTHYLSTGAVTTSSLLIKADGTYAWNSQWDGKVIQGTWAKDGNDLVLKKGQEGKDWRVSKSTNNGGDITIWDGNIWYIADRAKQ